MPVNSRRAGRRAVSDEVLEASDPSLLDLLDRVLSKGVMANGDLTIGVAGVDLIYVRLAALLCSAERVLVPERPAAAAKRLREERRSIGGSRKRVVARSGEQEPSEPRSVKGARQRRRKAQ